MSVDVIMRSSLQAFKADFFRALAHPIRIRILITPLPFTDAHGAVHRKPDAREAGIRSDSGTRQRNTAAA